MLVPHKLPPNPCWLYARPKLEGFPGPIVDFFDFDFSLSMHDQCFAMLSSWSSLFVICFVLCSRLHALCRQDRIIGSRSVLWSLRLNHRLKTSPVWRHLLAVLLLAHRCSLSIWHFPSITLQIQKTSMASKIPSHAPTFVLLSSISLNRDVIKACNLYSIWWIFMMDDRAKRGPGEQRWNVNVRRPLLPVWHIISNLWSVHIRVYWSIVPTEPEEGLRNPLSL